MDPYERQPDGSRRFRHVYFSARQSLWCAEVSIAGERRTASKRYSSEADAARAADDIVRKAGAAGAGKQLNFA